MASMICLSRCLSGIILIWWKFKFNLLLLVLISIILCIIWSCLHIELVIRPVNIRDLYMVNIVVLDTTWFTSVIARFTSISPTRFFSCTLNSLASEMGVPHVTVHRFCIDNFVYNITVFNVLLLYAIYMKVTFYIYSYCGNIQRPYLFKIHTAQMTMRVSDMIIATAIIRMDIISAGKKGHYR